MRLTVLGCGDAFGSGGRLNTCFHLTTAAGRQLLVDCGASAMIGMRRFGVDPGALDAVVLSHLHGDHFGGLPFLLLYSQYEIARERPLTIAGPPGVEARTGQAMEAFFGGVRCDWRFPLRFEELTPGTTAELAGVAVEPFPVVHGGGAPAYGLRVGDGDRLFAYSGDTTWTETLPAVAAGADLFVMECYAYDQRLPTHTDWTTLEAHLPDLTARRIMLTHMSDDMLAHKDQVPLTALEDGMVVDL